MTPISAFQGPGAFEKTVLPNGLRIVSSHMPYTRAVTVYIVIGAGSRYEEDVEGGVAHYLEHMFFKGTQRRLRPQDISGTIEGVGGEMNATTDHEDMVLWTKVARPYFRLAFDLVADMLHHSVFDPQEIEKERSVVLEELGMSNDDPDERAHIITDEVLFPGHPLGRDVGGTPATVRGITRDTILGYYEEQYRPSNTVISVAGDVEHQEVVALAQEALGDWGPGTPRSFRPARFDGAAPAARLEYRKTEQAHICLALPGLSSLHEDRYALDLLMTALGEGMSSRLFLELRERQGLVYEVHASANHFRDCGTVIFYAGTEPRRATRTLHALLQELRLSQDGFSPEELERARELVKGRLLLRMEDSRAVAGWMGRQELLRGEIYSVDAVTSFLDAVTVDDLARLARGLLDPGKSRLGVVGPFHSERRFRALLEG